MSIYRRSTQEKVRVDRLWNRTTPRTTSGAASQSGVGGPLPEHAHTGTGTGGILAFAFVTIGNTATLSNERALTAGNRFVITDGGAGSTVTLSARGIQDADNDTYIDTEASADEDILRFVTGGTARGRFTSLGLILVNANDFIMYTDDGAAQTIRFDGTLGHALFGNTGIDPSVQTTGDFSDVYTDPSTSLTGVASTTTISMTADNAQELVNFNAAAGASGPFNYTGRLIGVRSTLSLTNSVNASGGEFRQFWATAGSTRPLGTRWGFRVDDWLGAGVLTTQYGLYIEDLNSATTSWAIYSLGGNSAHVGAISIGSSTAAVASALLEMTSTTRGFLTPRMTTAQRDAIGSPATGLLIYNTTTNAHNFYNGSAWTAFGGGASSPLTTKGDLWGFTTVDARVPVGANGTMPMADSAQSTGLKYTNPAMVAWALG